jgi:hypothetical protein
MLTSKDTNFIGYTFKKSDILKSIESTGMQLWVLHTLSGQKRNFGILFVFGDFPDLRLYKKAGRLR